MMNGNKTGLTLTGEESGLFAYNDRILVCV